jgi:hypothetical protein
MPLAGQGGYHPRRERSIGSGMSNSTGGRSHISSATSVYPDCYAQGCHGGPSHGLEIIAVLHSRHLSCRYLHAVDDVLATPVPAMTLGEAHVKTVSTA